MERAAQETSRFTYHSGLKKRLSVWLCSSKRFSKAEIEAGVTGVLANVLDHIWEARVAGVPLPCLENENLDDNDEDI